MGSSELGSLLSGFDSKSSPLERFAVKKLSSVPSFLLIHAHSGVTWSNFATTPTKSSYLFDLKFLYT